MLGVWTDCTLVATTIHESECYSTVYLVATTMRFTTCVVQCACNGVYILLCHSGVFFSEDVPLVEFMYLVFTRMPGESYRRRVGTLFLCLCDVFRALMTPLVLILHERSWPRTVGWEASVCKCFPTSVHTAILSSVSPPLYILSYYQVFPHLCPYCHTIK